MRSFAICVSTADIDELFVYYTDNMMAGGTNTMAQILRMAMADLTIKLGGRGFNLPRTAWFQMDNCPSENKNKTINAYMSMLVDLGHLDVVQLNYLVVGHTHCPIDQKLGALSTIIHKQEFIATPEALMHLLMQPGRTNIEGWSSATCSIIRLIFNVSQAIASPLSSRKWM